MNTKKNTQDMSQAIAIVGLSCRFPKAENADVFWNSILRGEELISFFDKKDLLEKGVKQSLVDDPMYVRAGGSLDGHDLFDAKFFGLLPREAEVLDPQQRKFLECCCEAWEDAGYSSEYYSGSVGVFGGITMNTYLLEYVAKNESLMKVLGHLQLMIGNDKDFVTTRVSHQLNLTGPSYAVQSACSSSLVAIHVACSSLLNGECDMALSGGSSIRYPHAEGYMYYVGGTSSPDGHCRAFDKNAAGSVVGNGAGVLVLKRYEDAIRDKDHIYSIILGSATGNDGSDKPAYSTPSARGQARVISNALAMADVDATTIGYVEAHGTGTYIGDPIEISALRQAYQEHQADPNDKYYCVLGSVKPNIGHLDAAAGVSGMIKVIKMLQNKKIPPLVNFHEINPKMEIENGPFKFLNKAEEWKSMHGQPLRAGISSIGLGGANAHVILQEPPLQTESIKTQNAQVIPVSARTLNSFDKYVFNLEKYLDEHPDVNLTDFAFTMQVGRRAFEYREAFVASSVSELSAMLKTPRQKPVKVDCQKQPDIIFMFPGQGAQYPGMAKAMYKNNYTFQKALDSCFELINPLVGMDLRDVIFNSDTSNTDLNQTLCTQPILFAIEYALAQCWLSLDVKPKYLIGHSIGEFVAGCIAEVFTLKDAVSIIVERARLASNLPEGDMLAVVGIIDEVNAYLKQYPSISIAVRNSANRFVLSGDKENINSLKKKLEKARISSQPLMTSHAFHSQMFDKIVKQLEEKISVFKLNPPKIPLISNKTGDLMSEEMACDPNYWAAHIRNHVDFFGGLKTLGKINERAIFLEVGPGAGLTTLGKEILEEPHHCISSLGNSKSKQSEDQHYYQAIKHLWEKNIRINWLRLHENKPARLSLPTYPYELQRYMLNKPIQEKTMPDNNINSSWKQAAQEFLDILGNRSLSITISPTGNIVDKSYSTQDVQQHMISTQQTTCNQDIPQKKACSSVVANAYANSQNQIKPIGNIKHTMRQLWVELLGVEMNEITDESNISELGAHSLILTQLLTRIQQTFQVSCSIEDILNNPTLSEITSLVIARQSTNEDKPKRTASSHSGTSKPADVDIDEILSIASNMSETELEKLLTEVGES